MIAKTASISSIRGRQRVAILEKIKEIGNATCDEIERIMLIPHQTASARICELLKAKIIKDTGRKRLTKNKRPARVYEINEV